MSIIGQYDGLVVRSGVTVDEDLIAAAKQMRIVGRAGTGTRAKARGRAISTVHMRLFRRVVMFDVFDKLVGNDATGPRALVYLRVSAALRKSLWHCRSQGQFVAEVPISVLVDT